MRASRLSGGLEVNQVNVFQGMPHQRVMCVVGLCKWSFVAAAPKSFLAKPWFSRNDDSSAIKTYIVVV